MNKEFDFDDIGKKTPYRTPDNFFDWQGYWLFRLIYRREMYLQELRICWLWIEAAAIRLINGFMNCRMRSWKSSSTSLIMTYF